MSTPTFFHQGLDGSQRTAELPPNEASHAVNSRRLQVGQQICLINGRGLKAHCTIAERGRKVVLVQVDEVEQIPQPRQRLTVAVAVPKGDRQRTMVDMLTQHAVARIIPLQCAYSVTAGNDKLVEKWQRVAVEACKQSQNTWLPEIGPAQSVAELLGWLDQQTNTVAVYADGSGRKLAAAGIHSDQMAVLIGPEGGFSESEVGSFADAGLTAIRLADTILRTEAAAISAAAQIFALQSV